MFQRKPLQLKTYGRNNASNIGVGYGESWKALVNKIDDFDMLFSKSTRAKDLDNNAFNISCESSSEEEVSVKPKKVIIEKLLFDMSLEDEGKLSNVRTKKRKYVPKNSARRKKSPPRKMDLNYDTVILDSTLDFLIIEEQDRLKRKTEKQKTGKKKQSKDFQILKQIKVSNVSETATAGKECLVELDQSSFKKNLRSTKRALENQENEKRSADAFLEFDKPNQFITERKNKNVNIVNARKTCTSQNFPKSKQLENIKCNPSHRSSIDDFDIPATLRTRKKQKISIDLSEDENGKISNFPKKNQPPEIDSKIKLQQSFSNVDRMRTPQQVNECNLSLPKDRDFFVKPQTILRGKKFVPVISTPINDKCEKLIQFNKNFGGICQDTPSPIANFGQVCVPILSGDSVEALNSKSMNIESISSNLSSILEEPSKLGESSCNTTPGNNLNFSERVEISRNLFRMTILDISVDINEIKDYDISALLTGSKDLGKKLSDTEEILKLCNQEDILQFSDLFAKRLTRHNAKKISEGAFSEVFHIKFGNEWSVAKIIPVGGKNPLAGEKHMSLKAVLTEMIISESLSKLREASRNSCSTFIQLFETKFVKGEYPTGLIGAWKDYASENESENYNPASFDKDQLYVVLKYEAGGSDLEHTSLSKYVEVLSVYRQLSCALSVAEKSLNFEHRDLHLGNILISKTKDKFINYVVDGKTISVETSGVQVRIIDHTLSRLRLNNVNIFTNLSEYNIFNGTGDSQYDVYREMKAINKNNWDCYHPETNVLWLNFVLQKMMRKIKKPNCTMILFEKHNFLKERSSAFECMNGVIA